MEVEAAPRSELTAGSLSEIKLPRGALVAALLWLGSGLLIFFEGELLVDATFTFLTVLSIYLLLTSDDRNMRLPASGWAFGLAVVLAAAVTSAVLVGALALGDCVRYTLRDLALKRLGELSPGGQVKLLDGTVYDTSIPLELSAASTICL